MFKFVSTKNINELFQRAILQNDIQRTKLILEEAMKDPRFNIDQINEEGLTALQYSCFAGNAEIVKVLTAYGANWKIRDRDGYTLMHAAAMAGNGAVLRFLLQLGLKPVLKTDDGNFPIDVTDEISIIVILLRAMLDQGYLQEMQDYMMEHPKLKRNIFKELDKVKCREQEKNEILNEMPYTSHTLPRQKGTTITAAPTPPKPPQVEKVKKSSKGGGRRSTSTFSELSDSIQQLDKLGLDPKLNTDLNNNDIVDSYVSHRASDTDTDTLKRDNSFSSTSSHSSKSSLRSGSGILRVGGNRHDGTNSEADNAYRNTQQYLESRFPTIPARPKSVTFDFDADSTNERRYSDGHPANTYCDENGIPLQPTATQNNIINLNPVPDLDEPLYENASNARMRAKLTNVDSPGKVISQTSQKQAPPPLPPRAPTTQLTDSIRLNHISFNSNNTNNTNNKTIYEDNYISDRQLGSETDSGIDVNETAGRMFALSVNDRRDDDPFSRPMTYQHADNFSNSYYSDTYRTLPRQLHSQSHSQSDLDPPINFGMRNRNNYADNSKYRSWNGRSFHENANNNNNNVEPYTSHSNYRTINSSNFYDTRYSNSQTQSSNSSTSPVSPNHSSNNSYSANVEPDFSQYDFDNQPEIML